MKISFVEIQNFRKLKSCRIEIAPKETILVGANNSGKTSAMDSMILFLKKKRRTEITTTDFTLSNWAYINKIGTQWTTVSDDNKPDLTLETWLPYLPAIDIWLDANDADIYHLIHLLPTLDWEPKQKLGVRLLFGPKDIEKLYKEFREAYQSARYIEASASLKNKSNLSLWPESMRDFLDKELHRHCGVKAYILDPNKSKESKDGIANPQPLPTDSEPISKEPFEGLIKIDVISAQRGFSDPKTEDESHSGFESLSKQLRQYFTKHLNPSDSPDVSDINALQAIEEAKTIFDEKLKISFASAIGELEGLNYPGFSDPKISLTSKISAIDSLDHKTAVQFNVLPEYDEWTDLLLPEKYNGLGYQNLISMVFKLIRFRDEWMRIGKAAKKQSGDNTVIEPLHIVLIEEPEAHLHAQVQQVFIKKAYRLLRNNKNLDECLLNTQMIVSTHSSHIAHELDFTCLRYFRRELANQKGEIPLASIVNLSGVFGDDTETSRFATRYIKSTHCDLFFADAAILIEGSAERMLLPHFVRDQFPKLDQSYISFLEIGGSHAHRLKPLLETLGLLTLVITDLDSIGEIGTTKVLPERDKGYSTGNTTLKKWIPKKAALDELLNCPNADKETENKQIRVAYQCPIQLKYKDGTKGQEAIPYTFEDSLALSNLKLFRDYQNPKGLLKKLKDALKKDSLGEARQKMFEGLETGSKAEMALELFYLTEPKDLVPPDYILDGLKWLEDRLLEKKQYSMPTETKEGEK
ncbi:MAG: AAA family ATPase [Nitrospirae bacterium]|nr:AAA family ATPase [Candidatus Manganitrophaceae bacterium]